MNKKDMEHLNKKMEGGPVKVIVNGKEIDARDFAKMHKEKKTAKKGK